MPLFDAAISSLRQDEGDHFGPFSFLRYCQEQGFSAGRTAEHISVDSIDRLAPELRANDCMVLRLGQATDGRGTQFAVVRIPGDSPGCFFLNDRELFDHEPIRTFLPRAEVVELFAYGLLNSLTENSATLLAFATGLMAQALELDDRDRKILPASGNSTYRFGFGVHPFYPVTLEHRNGQVEFDALFLAKRDGRDTVFILEAKKSEGLRSLAKHKLAYPVFGIKAGGRLPDGFGIVPVYLRIIHLGSQLIYNVAECAFASPGAHETLATLTARRVVRYRLWLPSSV